MAYCERCGKKIDGEYKYCPRCGAPLESAEATPRRQKEQVERPLRARHRAEAESVQSSGLIWVVLMIALAVVVALLVFFLLRGRSPASGVAEGTTSTGSNVAGEINPHDAQQDIPEGDNKPGTAAQAVTIAPTETPTPTPTPTPDPTPEPTPTPTPEPTPTPTPTPTSTPEPTPISAVGEGEAVFPDSSSRLLTDDEVNALDMEKTQTAINELWARHGYTFSDQKWLAYFKQFSWYNPTISKQDWDKNGGAGAYLSDIEMKNQNKLANHRDKLKND